MFKLNSLSNKLLTNDRYHLQANLIFNVLWARNPLTEFYDFITTIYSTYVTVYLGGVVNIKTLICRKKIISFLITEWSLFVKPWVPFIKGCFVSSLVEIDQVVLEETIFKFCQFIFAISLLSPLRTGRCPLPKDVLFQIWLKKAQWFLRRRWKCEKFADGRKATQTDDERHVIRKAYLSFQLRWA